MQYSYPVLNPNWDLQVLTTKIFAALGTRPSTNDWLMGLSATETSIIVYTSRDLTSDEKSKLDGLMSDVNAGLSPITTSGFTVFEVTDVFNGWSTLESSSITVQHVFVFGFPKNKFEIWVPVLSVSDKKKLLSAYQSLIKEKV